jgi:Tol biopolymer transport system component
MSISRDGRYVAFSMAATNLDPNATAEGRLYLFVYDRTVRAVRAMDWDVPSGTGAISGDGSYVVFWCRRVAGPGSGSSPNDLCTRPVSGGEVSRITIGAFSFGLSPPVVSGNGRWILFGYSGPSLVPTLVNPPDQVQLYVLDVTTGILEMLTRSANGEPGDFSSGYTFNYAINHDGDFVSFSSVATNLIPGVSAGGAIVVKQRSTGTYRLASPNSFAGAFVPSLSDDGRRVFYLDYTGFFANQLGFIYDWNTNRRRSITGPIPGATTGRICQGSLFLGVPPAEALVQTVALSGDGRSAFFSHHGDVPFTPFDPCQLYVRNLGPVPSEPVGVPAVSPGWVILFAGLSFLVAFRALRPTAR